MKQCDKVYMAKGYQLAVDEMIRVMEKADMEYDKFVIPLQVQKELWAMRGKAEDFLEENKGALE